MEEKTIILNGDKFVFVCRRKSVSGGFCHLCTLLKNDSEVASESVRYYNRTWEAYPFQTVMLKCARKIKNEELIAKLKIS